MNIDSFKESRDFPPKRHEDGPLGKSPIKMPKLPIPDYDKPLKIPSRKEMELPPMMAEPTQENSNDVKPIEKKDSPIQNKIDGLRREAEVENELRDKYPESEGYKTESEVYLRDKDGNIVKDPETGEARRIDFVVVKDGKAVESIEVTSKTADKTAQSAKEDRIRDAGGNYIKDSNGNLIEIPADVTTRIERRD